MQVKEPWTMNVGSHQVIVDYDMLPILKQFTWYVRENHTGGLFYAASSGRMAGKQVHILMHRLLTGFSAHLVDHRNGNGLDNRLENLRLCSEVENSTNARKRSDSKSTYRGVGFLRGKWIAKIKSKGKDMHLGTFATEIEAARAYDEASRRFHGEFGRRNFPD